MARVTIGKRAFAKLESICQALPQSTVEPWYDHFNLRVRGKTFAWQSNDHHGDGRVALHIKAPPGVQETLVDLDPDRFFVPPYVGPYGWVGVRLEKNVDWAGVEKLLRDAWRMTAPKKLIAQLDGTPPRAKRTRR